MSAKGAPVVRVEVLEPEDVFFFYRPRIDVAVPRGLDDVARLYLALRARPDPRYRLLIVGEKRLPATTRDGDRRSWAFVERVGDRPEAVEDELDPERYVTKTRGERTVPAARPAGEGVGAIVRHEDHTHLAYQLEMPDEPGEVQRALNVGPQGSYVVSVRNPDSPAPPGLGLDPRRRAGYPDELRARFRGRRFIPLDPPAFLDYEGAELVLIGASPDVGAELGLRLDTERETEATAEIFADLGLERDLHPVEPLLRGQWA